MEPDQLVRWRFVVQLAEDKAPGWKPISAWRRLSASCGTDRTRRTCCTARRAPPRSRTRSTAGESAGALRAAWRPSFLAVQSPGGRGAEPRAARGPGRRAPAPRSGGRTSRQCGAAVTGRAGRPVAVPRGRAGPGPASPGSAEPVELGPGGGQVTLGPLALLGAGFLEHLGAGIEHVPQFVPLAVGVGAVGAGRTVR